MDVIWDAIRDAVQLLVGGDQQTYEIIWLSLRVSLSATAIAFVLGLPLGMLLAFGCFRGRRPVLARTPSPRPACIPTSWRRWCRSSWAVCDD